MLISGAYAWLKLERLKQSLIDADVEISDDMFILKAEDAQKLLEPPRLANRNETLIVIGSDTKHVRAALDVLDGKKDGLDKDSPLVAGVAKRALFVSRANNVPEAYRKTTKCPVLRNCSAAFAQWTENKGRIAGKYRFITDSEETAQNYKAIVDGFMAMAKLRSGESKAVMKVIDGLECTAKGNSFRIIWKSTTDDVQAALGQMMKHKGGSRCGKNPRRVAATAQRCGA